MSAQILDGRATAAAIRSAPRAMLLTNVFEAAERAANITPDPMLSEVFP